jgi:integrase
MTSGNVSRRRGGEWQYRFELGPDPLTGTRRRETKSGFATKREAVAAMRTAIMAHEQGRLVSRNRRTVADYLLEWHAGARASVRPTTWTNYRDYMRAYVLPHIGATRLQELSPMRLNRLYAYLLTDGRVRSPGGLAPKTVQNVHRMLHRALSDAVKWGLLPRNVAEDARAPRVGRTRPTIWSPDQLYAFVQRVQDDRFFALWLLVVTTGLRRGELAGLLAEDVDLAFGRVSPSRPRVVVAGRAEESETKTEAGARSLALDPTTRQALARYIATWREERRLLGQSTDLLFVWPSGQPLHPDTITGLFHRHAAAAGLPKIRLHDVRHSYATAALRAGVSPKVLSERLGHSTVAFTLQTYTHVIPKMDEEAAAEAAAFILQVGRSEISDGTILGTNSISSRQNKNWPGTKSQASGGSGGRI